LIRSAAIVCLILLATETAIGSSRVKSSRSAYDASPDTNPNSDFWRDTPAAFAETDIFGNSFPEYRTELRSRWTKENLYFLLICPYEQLNLKPHPQTTSETNGLWNWDVAEVFIGSDFANIRRYYEFEVSPQGEWTDLAINLDVPHHEDGWLWNSGFRVSARIDSIAHKWYAFMRIPFSSVDSRPAVVGRRLRINFFLSEGPKSNYKAIAWHAPHQPTFHVPQVFGRLELEN
jgi:hypothetical protein